MARGHRAARRQLRGDALIHIAVATALGAGVGLIAGEHGRNHAATAATGLLVEQLWWIVGPLTIAPLVADNAPAWTAEEAAARFPALVACLFLTGRGS